MYLVHTPTGIGVGLAKRMSWGWYISKSGTNLDIGTLFQVLEEEYSYDGEQDSFTIVLESSEDWVVSQLLDNGLIKFSHRPYVS